MFMWPSSVRKSPRIETVEYSIYIDLLPDWQLSSIYIYICVCDCAYMHARIHHTHTQLFAWSRIAMRRWMCSCVCGRAGLRKRNKRVEENQKPPKQTKPNQTNKTDSPPVFVPQNDHTQNLETLPQLAPRGIHQLIPWGSWVETNTLPPMCPPGPGQMRKRWLFYGTIVKYE